jgi:hypothetical protein
MPLIAHEFCVRCPICGRFAARCDESPEPEAAETQITWEFVFLCVSVALW